MEVAKGLGGGSGSEMEKRLEMVGIKIKATKTESKASGDILGKEECQGTHFHLWRRNEHTKKSKDGLKDLGGK